ncbi:ankyrin repeat domain-containing protein [bacterium]
MKSFYEIAIKRDEVLTSNMLKEIQSLNSSQASIMVCGGFHTDGITSILRSKGISYEVIRPNMQGTYDKEVYLNRMKEQVRWMGMNEELRITDNIGTGQGFGFDSWSNSVPTSDFKDSLAPNSMFNCPQENCADPIIDAEVLAQLSAQKKQNLLSILAVAKKEKNNSKIKKIMEYAISAKDMETISLLLEKKIDPNIKNDSNRSMLEIAINGRYPEIVKLLLNARANPNAKSADSNSLLSIGAVYPKGSIKLLEIAVGQYPHANEIVRLLLEARANPNAKDRYNRSMLGKAIFMFINSGCENREILKTVRLLLDLEPRNNSMQIFRGQIESYSTVMVNEQRKRKIREVIKEMLKSLLRKGVEIDKKTKKFIESDSSRKELFEAIKQQAENEARRELLLDLSPKMSIEIVDFLLSLVPLHEGDPDPEAKGPALHQGSPKAFVKNILAGLESMASLPRIFFDLKPVVDSITSRNVPITDENIRGILAASGREASEQQKEKASELLGYFIEQKQLGELNRIQVFHLPYASIKGARIDLKIIGDTIYVSEELIDSMIEGDITKEELFSHELLESLLMERLRNLRQGSQEFEIMDAKDDHEMHLLSGNERDKWSRKADDIEGFFEGEDIKRYIETDVKISKADIKEIFKAVEVMRLDEEQGQSELAHQLALLAQPSFDKRYNRFVYGQEGFVENKRSIIYKRIHRIVLWLGIIGLVFVESCCIAMLLNVTFPFAFQVVLICVGSLLLLALIYFLYLYVCIDRIKNAFFRRFGDMPDFSIFIYHDYNNHYDYNYSYSALTMYLELDNLSAVKEIMKRRPDVLLGKSQLVYLTVSRGLNFLEGFRDEKEINTDILDKKMDEYKAIILILLEKGLDPNIGLPNHHFVNIRPLRLVLNHYLDTENEILRDYYKRWAYFLVENGAKLSKVRKSLLKNLKDNHKSFYDELKQKEAEIKDEVEQAPFRVALRNTRGLFPKDLQETVVSFIGSAETKRPALAKGPALHRGTLMEVFNNVYIALSSLMKVVPLRFAGLKVLMSRLVDIKNISDEDMENILIEAANGVELSEEEKEEARGVLGYFKEAEQFKHLTNIVVFHLPYENSAGARMDLKIVNDRMYISQELLQSIMKREITKEELRMHEIAETGLIEILQNPQSIVNTETNDRSTALLKKHNPEHNDINNIKSFFSELSTKELMDPEAKIKEATIEKIYKKVQALKLNPQEQDAELAHQIALLRQPDLGKKYTRFPYMDEKFGKDKRRIILKKINKIANGITVLTLLLFVCGGTMVLLGLSIPGTLWICIGSLFCLAMVYKYFYERFMNSNNIDNIRRINRKYGLNVDFKQQGSIEGDYKDLLDKACRAGCISAVKEILQTKQCFLLATSAPLTSTVQGCIDVVSRVKEETEDEKNLDRSREKIKPYENIIKLLIEAGVDPRVFPCSFDSKLPLQLVLEAYICEPDEFFKEYYKRLVFFLMENGARLDNISEGILEGLNSRGAMDVVYAKQREIDSVKEAAHQKVSLKYMLGDDRKLPAGIVDAVLSFLGDPSNPSPVGLTHRLPSGSTPTGILGIKNGRFLVIGAPDGFVHEVDMQTGETRISPYSALDFQSIEESDLIGCVQVAVSNLFTTEDGKKLPVGAIGRLFKIENLLNKKQVSQNKIQELQTIRFAQLAV